MHTLKPPKRVHICFLLQTNLLLTQKHKFTQKHEGRENAASPIPPSTAGSSGMPPKSCLLSLLVLCLGHASRPASPTGQLQCGTGGSRAELSGAEQSSPARPGPAQPSPARLSRLSPRRSAAAEAWSSGSRTAPCAPPAPPAGILAGREIFQENIKLLCNT